MAAFRTLDAIVTMDVILFQCSLKQLVKTHQWTSANFASLESVLDVANVQWFLSILSPRSALSAHTRDPGFSAANQPSLSDCTNGDS